MFTVSNEVASLSNWATFNVTLNPNHLSICFWWKTFSEGVDSNAPAIISTANEGKAFLYVG